MDQALVYLIGVLLMAIVYAAWFYGSGRKKRLSYANVEMTVVLMLAIACIGAYLCTK